MLGFMVTLTMSTPSTFPLHDRLVHGQLERMLRTMRAEGLTYDEIAWRLKPDVNVSRSTVARWCNDLGIEAA